MKKRYAYIASAFRGACITLCTLFIYSLIGLLLRAAIATDSPLFEGVEVFVICIFATAVIPLLFNSVSLAFSYGDRRRIEDFIGREDDGISFRREMKILFTDPMSIIELVSTNLLILVFALLGTFTTFEGMFPDGMPIGNLLPALIITPICFVLYLISKYEAVRYHKALVRNAQIDKLLSPWWLPIRIGILTVLYFIGTPIAPVLIFMIFTAVMTFIKLSKLWTMIGLLIFIVLLIFAIWGIKVLFGIKKRKKFLSRMTKTAKSEGYEIGEIKNPYRSFATSKNHCCFMLKKDGRTFDCIVISTLWRSVPLVFTSSTQAAYLHRIGTENHNFTLRHNIDFYHTGEGDKIIIVDPVPKKVLIEDLGKMEKIYCSDKIWKITMHDADSFIGCIDRNCLS